MSRKARRAAGIRTTDMKEVFAAMMMRGDPAECRVNPQPDFEIRQYLQMRRAEQRKLDRAPRKYSTRSHPEHEISFRCDDDEW